MLINFPMFQNKYKDNFQEKRHNQNEHWLKDVVWQRLEKKLLDARVRVINEEPGASEEYAKEI